MREKIILILILVFAGLIYFYKLDKIPSGFYVDEATIAYNAKSTLETGKDEYGFPYPVVFRLMGSYSPSLFIYLSAVAIKFFGSEPIVFRSLTALSSIAGVLFFFLLVRKLELYKLKISYFIVPFFFAISPWMVFNARLGYETTFGFVLFSIAAYYLFLSLEKPKNLIASSFFFSLSTYASHNEKTLLPLFLLGFFIVFWKDFVVRKNFKIIAISFLVGAITQIPNLSLIATNAFWIKSSQFTTDFFWRFLTYISPRTLFFDNPDIDLQHTTPKLSILFNWMVVPYFIGIYLLVKRLKDYRYKFLVIYILSSIIPSIFSSQFFSSQKVLPLSIPLLIVLGVGMDEILIRLSVLKRICVLILVSSYSLLVLFASYFVLFPKERANGWNYGYDRVAEYIKENPKEKFLFDSNRNPRAYILLLYFLNIPPGQYQKEVDPFYRNNYYSAPVPATYYRFLNVEVREINWEIDAKRNITIIGDNLSISDNQAKEHKLTKIKEFKDPLGNVIFEIYKTGLTKPI